MGRWAVDYNQLADRFDERYKYETYPGIRTQPRNLIDQPRLRVLEVGCGTGHWLTALGDLRATLLGVDPSEAMLHKARCQAAGAALLCASAEGLPFSSKSLDVIFCVNAFHHFSDPAKFINNNRFLLKKGGQLAIFGLDPHAPEIKWYVYDYFPGVREIDLRRFLPHKEIGALMAEAGFQNIITRLAERIQRTYFGGEVLSDPFLERTSTSQLQLISEKSYAQGKQAITSRLESGNQANGAASFIIDLPLFATIATCGD